MRRGLHPGGLVYAEGGSLAILKAWLMVAIIRLRKWKGNNGLFQSHNTTLPVTIGLTANFVLLAFALKLKCFLSFKMVKVMQWNIVLKKYFLSKLELTMTKMVHL